MFADVIVDISHEAVDRTFEYIIPQRLEQAIRRGSQVNIPFGKSNRIIKGFVTDIKSKASFDSARLKEIDSVAEHTATLESAMIELAGFIRANYGATMNQALKTVLPASRAAKPVAEKYLCLNAGKEETEAALKRLASDKRSPAKLRLLTELSRETILPAMVVREKLNISPQTIRSLEKEGLLRVDVRENLRDALHLQAERGYHIRLTDEQQAVTDGIWGRYQKGDRRPSLIRGITGSGKTEIYIELISRMIAQGKQAIVLIPEIALTYQTVLRFYKKFGDRISVIHSRLTYAEKFDQLEKARIGQVDIIIGPRSALFSPFPNLGIVIIDEEHEGTYKNENVPRYHSREVAIKRAEMAGGIVVMGSATPSVESYYKAKEGAYALYTLESRPGGAQLPDVEIVDLREELARGNRSILSDRLRELIEDRLQKKEQVILFINRRGYSSFVSCRSCGEAIKCPHCDVSLKYHRSGKLMCHYCGFEMPMVKTCPKCGSKYIGTFGTGTQKVEEEIERFYPGARVLRMDYDTTRTKDAHEKILSAFAGHEADILIGTQMIVKGHDFANVTLVGIVAADLSLYSGDYTASERTFQLLVQAAGRAGRGEKPGNVVVQTYSPDNYAVELGAKQDYPEFYEYEMSYRKLLGYPPVMNMLGILFSCENERKLAQICTIISSEIDRAIEGCGRDIRKIGPAEATIAKLNDRFRKMIYIKAEEYRDLTRIKDLVEEFMEAQPDQDVTAAFDFSMMGR